MNNSEITEKKIIEYLEFISCAGVGAVIANDENEKIANEIIEILCNKYSMFTINKAKYLI